MGEQTNRQRTDQDWLSGLLVSFSKGLSILNMKLLFVVIVLAAGKCLGHSHGNHHGDSAEHFHEDEHLEDHRHWYTKEANEKLQEVLKDAKKKDTTKASELDHEDEPPLGNEEKRGETLSGAAEPEIHSDVREKERAHSHEHDMHGGDQNHDSHNANSHGHHGHSDDGPSHHGHHGHSHHGHHGHHGHGHHGHSHHGHGHHGHGHHGHSHHGHSHHGHSDAGHGHHGHSHEHETQDNVKETEQSEKAPKMQAMRYIWLESILSTCLISAAPFFILFFVPLESNSEEQRPFLKVLLSFASGGLLGDAFLHLIPHAVSPHSHNVEAGHSHSHGHSHHEGETPEHAHDHSADMIVGLWVLAGMLAFLIVEKFVRHVKGGHSHSHGHKPLRSKDDGDSKVIKSDRLDDDKNSGLKDRKKEGKVDSVAKAKPGEDSGNFVCSYVQ